MTSPMCNQCARPLAVVLLTPIWGASVVTVHGADLSEGKFKGTSALIRNIVKKYSGKYDLYIWSVQSAGYSVWTQPSVYTVDNTILLYKQSFLEDVLGLITFCIQITTYSTLIPNWQEKTVHCTWMLPSFSSLGLWQGWSPHIWIWTMWTVHNFSAAIVTL